MAMLTSFARPYFGRWSTSFFFFHHLWHANLRSGEEFYQLPPCPLRVATQVGLLLLLFALSKHILLREIAQSLPASTPSHGWKQHVFWQNLLTGSVFFFFFQGQQSSYLKFPRTCWLTEAVCALMPATSFTHTLTRCVFYSRRHPWISVVGGRFQGASTADLQAVL